MKFTSSLMAGSLMAGSLMAGSLVGLPGAAQAATYPTSVTPVTLGTTAYTQNFNTLAASGTSSTLPAGWQVSEGGTSGDGTYAAGTGSSNTGNVYSFGTDSSDRALGSLASGSVTPIYFGALFGNGLTGNIGSLAISYTGEQWRSGGSPDDLLTFQYLVNATDISTGNWVTFAPLNFVSPNLSGTGAIDGNAAANRQLLSATISGLSIASGSVFGIRWFDANSTGSDDGLAVDDFSIRAIGAVSAVPEPSTWAMMLVGFGALGVAMRRRQGARRAFVTA